MKILLIGGTGTIGRAVSKALSGKHEIVIAGRNSGQVQVDITESASIRQLYQSVGRIDALVCTAGEAKWAPFSEMTEEDFYIGIRSKLMGQVNLVRIGRDYVKEGGSFTLTTGILAEDPVPMTSSAAMVNGAIHSFVMAAALELDGYRRINAVASGLVEEAVDRYRDYFPGHHPVPMWKMVNGYIRSIEGKGNGEIIRIYE